MANEENKIKRLEKALIESTLIKNKDLEYKIESLENNQYKIKLCYSYKNKKIGTRVGLAFIEEIEYIYQAMTKAIAAIKRYVYRKCYDFLVNKEIEPSGIFNYLNYYNKYDVDIDRILKITSSVSFEKPETVEEYCKWRDSAIQTPFINEYEYFYPPCTYIEKQCELQLLEDRLNKSIKVDPKEEELSEKFDIKDE